MNAKKLLEAYKYLGWAQDSAKRNEKIDEHTISHIMNLIHEFMIGHEPKKEEHI